MTGGLSNDEEQVIANMLRVLDLFEESTRAWVELVASLERRVNAFDDRLSAHVGQARIEIDDVRYQLNVMRQREDELYQALSSLERSRHTHETG